MLGPVDRPYIFLTCKNVHMGVPENAIGISASGKT